jgi:signal transduction histidine kinase
MLLDIQTGSLSSILDSALSKIDLGEVRAEYPKEDLTISYDGSKMEIVFSNLILNAVQAMEKKGTSS